VSHFDFPGKSWEKTESVKKLAGQTERLLKSIGQEKLAGELEDAVTDMSIELAENYFDLGVSIGLALSNPATARGVGWVFDCLMQGQAKRYPDLKKLIHPKREKGGQKR
jgi:hypothetical protein